LIILTDINWLTVSSVRETLTTIKQLAFTKNIYIACLIAELNSESEHISYTSYFKIKTTSKLSILNHTYICALKHSYFCTRVYILILTTFKHFQIP